MFRFETLDIWKLALEYCHKIFEIAKKFPSSAQFNLGAQIRDAVLSISNNIAEGSGSDTKQQFRNFLKYSVRSTYEVVSMLFIAKRNNYIDQASFDEFYNTAEVLVKKIRAFKNTL